MPTLPNGMEVKLGCKQPDVLRFAALPAWDEKNVVIAESDTEDHNDLAEYVQQINHQKNSNCTNASLAKAMEVMFRAQGMACPKLSQTMQYVLHNGGRDEGAFCRDLAADVKAPDGRGLCAESLWGDEKPIYRGQLPKEVLDDAKTRLALEIYQCQSWADVRSALAYRFVVYHGFVLGGSFFGTHGDGKVPAFDGSLSNGHAMVSIGLTRKFGDLRTITPNSWDTTFGDQGYGYIPASYFWGQNGNFVNLDAYAIRAVKRQN